MIPRAAAVLLCAAALAGCEFVSEVLEPAPRPTVTRLEVFNRTEEPIFLIDANGQRLDVAACDRAVADLFVLDEVEIRTDGGYAYTFGAPAPDPVAPPPQWLVVTSGISGGPMAEAPADLPACRGTLVVQPDV